MDDTVGIVLENTKILADVCGSNDYNLGVMERLLGSRVFSRGNELFLEDGNPDSRRLFSDLLESLLESMADGLPATPDLIIALHANLTPLGERRATCADSGD